MPRIHQSKMPSATLLSLWRGEQGRVNAILQAPRPLVRCPSWETPQPGPGYFQFHPGRKGRPAFLLCPRPHPASRPRALVPQRPRPGVCSPSGGAESLHEPLRNGSGSWKQKREGKGTGPREAHILVPKSNYLPSGLQSFCFFLACLRIPF